MINFVGDNWLVKMGPPLTSSTAELIVKVAITTFQTGFLSSPDLILSHAQIPIVLASIVNASCIYE